MICHYSTQYAGTSTLSDIESNEAKSVFECFPYLSAMQDGTGKKMNINTVHAVH